MGKWIMAMSVLLMASLAIAGGNGSGGGDAQCAEYTDMVGQIASTLVTIGQAQVDKVNAVIRVADLWKIKQTPLRCFPVTQLDRPARSYPDGVYTNLLVADYKGLTAWDKYNQSQKLRLAAHELSVLARYETDGEYFISKSIIQLVMTSWNASKAAQVIPNGDGSVTFIDPYITVNGTSYNFGEESYCDYDVLDGSCGNVTSPDALDNANGTEDLTKQLDAEAGGVCAFFGFARSVDYAHNQASDQSGLFYADVTGDGHFNGAWSKSSDSERENTRWFVSYITTLTCAYQ